MREAEERGRRQQIVDSRLEDHDRQIRTNTKGIVEIKTSLETLTGEIREDRAVKDALARAAKDLAEKQVSAKSFYVGVALVLVSVVGLFLSGAHF